MTSSILYFSLLCILCLSPLSFSQLWQTASLIKCAGSYSGEALRYCPWNIWISTLLFAEHRSDSRNTPSSHFRIIVASRSAFTHTTGGIQLFHSASGRCRNKALRKLTVSLCSAKGSTTVQSYEGRTCGFANRLFGHQTPLIIRIKVWFILGIIVLSEKHAFRS